MRVKTRISGGKNVHEIVLMFAICLCFCQFSLNYLKSGQTMRNKGTFNIFLSSYGCESSKVHSVDREQYLQDIISDCANNTFLILYVCAYKVQWKMAVREKQQYTQSTDKTSQLLIHTRITIVWAAFCKNTDTTLHTHPVRSVCTAADRCVSSSRATLSPIAARQSSMEFSGLAGVNTSDLWQSNPVLEKAATNTDHRNEWYLWRAVRFVYRS